MVVRGAFENNTLCLSSNPPRTHVCITTLKQNKDHVTWDQVVVYIQ